MSKLNLRDRLEDGELDLSMSDLEEIPVKEIISIKKARTLDLSNNRITKLGRNFASLTHIVKLDLGKNLLTELPDNFGDMVQLRHLDLYSNKIDRLPLSFGRLKNLRWLDLKGNPLVPKLAEVAGPCLDAAECARCARAVVNLLHNMAVSIEEEKARREQQRQLQQTEAQSTAVQPKREAKRKKKGGSKGEGAAAAEGHRGASAAERNKVNAEKLSPELQNGRGLKEKQRQPALRSTKGLGVCMLLLLLIPALLLTSAGALFFLDEPLFWEWFEATGMFCKDGASAIVAWLQMQGLQGVKDWAGGGLEAARASIVQLYDDVSAKIPVYIESAKKIF
ncbi:leucine-rich repeat-containing protein 59-like [Ischnura elegans]|uniref:leucine-rich repeat-containing protein 59-like n=1 Tax=Ischnura elegans TaxID=197161 RepID=UPI001ED88062|nr:leucine-rich repeat-containing protein 59-like [Ischnura elegans]